LLKLASGGLIFFDFFRFFSIFFDSISWQILETKGLTGQLEVTATLRTSRTYLIGGFGSISDTLAVKLVDEASVDPDQVAIHARIGTFGHFGHLFRF
jgi:hypothetical protein